MNVTNCSSCGALIAWVLMQPSGRRMPIDAKPQKRVVLNEQEPSIARVVDTYVSHFSTCPHSVQHRSRGAQKEGSKSR